MISQPVSQSDRDDVFKAWDVLDKILSRRSPPSTLHSKLEWHWTCAWKFYSVLRDQAFNTCPRHVEKAKAYCIAACPEYEHLISRCTDLDVLVNLVEDEFPSRFQSQKFQPNVDTSRFYKYLYLGKEIGATPSGRRCYDFVMKCKECHYRHEAIDACANLDKQTPPSEHAKAVKAGPSHLTAVFDKTEGSTLPYTFTMYAYDSDNNYYAFIIPTADDMEGPVLFTHIVIRLFAAYGYRFEGHQGLNQIMYMKAEGLMLYIGPYDKDGDLYGDLYLIPKPKRVKAPVPLSRRQGSPSVSSPAPASPAVSSTASKPKKKKKNKNKKKKKTAQTESTSGTNTEAAGPSPPRTTNTDGGVAELERNLAQFNLDDFVMSFVEADIKVLLRLEEKAKSDSEFKPAKIGPPATRPLDAIHCGFYAPLRNEVGGTEYHLLVFIDEYTRYVEPYFCLDRSQATFKAKLQEFITTAEKSFSFEGYKAKRVITYSGHTYSGQVDDWLASKSIEHQVIPGPLKNGLLERHKRSVYETTVKIMRRAKVTKHFWLFALRHAIHLRNLAVHSTTGRIPYVDWTDSALETEIKTPWGCHAYVATEDSYLTDRAAQAYQGIYLGRDLFTEASIVLLRKNEIVKSMDVQFDEGKFGYTAASFIDMISMSLEYCTVEEFTEHAETSSPMRPITTDPIFYGPKSLVYNTRPSA